MKATPVLFISLLFYCNHLFSQVTKTLKSPAQNTAVTTSPVKQTVPAKPAQANQAPPTDLERASINILTGDDGKDNDTYLRIVLYDENKRTASAYPSDKGSATKDEYFVGEMVSLAMVLDPSVPTPEMKMAGGVPIPVMREAVLADFSNGGDMQIQIKPNGHDTWKINTISITLSFKNDPGSPHKITWSNLVLTQDSRNRDLLFDKNFNPIQ